MIDTSKLHSTETEVDVIAACIMEPAMFESVREIMSRDLFQDYDCGKAYDAMCKIADEGKHPDFVEMTGILSKDKVSVQRFISDHQLGYELTKQRIYFLQDLSIRRRLAAIFYKGEAMVCDPTITIEDVQSLLNEFEEAINNNSGDLVQLFTKELGGLINDVAERKEEKGERGIMTGLRLFDSRFGWHGGDLIIIAGETSMGKSTLATTIAYNMASAGVPVAYYSLEMSSRQLVARIIARVTEVSSSTLLYGKLSDNEYDRVYDSTLKLKNLPIYFDENSKVSFPKICSSIRMMRKRYGVRVAFIDYLQILANGRGDNREQLIGDMARDLKRLAVETDTVIVALSQLARDRQNKEPSLNRLRGSGQIEEACDVGVLIHRSNLRSDDAKIYIAKGRNIGLATERVKFNSSLSYFCDYEEGDPQAGYKEHKEELPF